MLELFLSSLPDLHTLLIVAPIALAYGLLVSWFVGYLRLQRGVRTAYTRKIFHFSVFTVASILHIIWHLPAVTVLGITMSIIVVHAVRRGKGHPLFEALARPKDEPHRAMFVIVPLITTAIGGIATNTFFPQVAYIGYLVCGWGDAVGEPVGSKWGKHPYRVPSLSGVPAERTLEGSTAVFVVGSFAAVMGLLAMGEPVAHALWLGVLCGVAGAVVEAISNHGLDNLTTQIAAAAVAYFLI